ncbi:hypothetical protein [Actinoplanes sp. NPDC023714]|uniref:hypothetical protein n=1 Tax=Actinoplanes sp. NPDC023714 TaxID=3154322 RepID=UPI0033D9C808
MRSRIGWRRLLVGASLTAGVLACCWGGWFLTLLVTGGEGAMPPESRIPEIPAGATVVEQSRQCGSGGCWWQITVAPEPGRSPEELAAAMGIEEERTESPTLTDPAYVSIGGTVRGGNLVVHVGYR